MTELVKPGWVAPLNYLFGPVWPVLYLLMGVSLAFALAREFERRDVQITA